jgi:thiamine biosynthesis lipoprotein
MRHGFETMGTAASIELPEQCSSLLPDVQRVFEDVDQRFSL